MQKTVETCADENTTRIDPIVQVFELKYSSIRSAAIHKNRRLGTINVYDGFHDGEYAYNLKYACYILNNKDRSAVRKVRDYIL